MCGACGAIRLDDEGFEHGMCCAGDHSARDGPAVGRARRRMVSHRNIVGWQEPACPRSRSRRPPRRVASNLRLMNGQSRLGPQYICPKNRPGWHALSSRSVSRSGRAKRRYRTLHRPRPFSAISSSCRRTPLDISQPGDALHRQGLSPILARVSTATPATTATAASAFV